MNIQKLIQCSIIEVKDDDSFESDSSMEDYGYSSEEDSQSEKLVFNKDLEEVKEPAARNGTYTN